MSSLSNSESVNKWNQAITDAETMLYKAQDRVRQLEEAIRIFKHRRDTGEPFFGERRSQTGASGK